jgi:hypothetical protein
VELPFVVHNPFILYVKMQINVVFCKETIVNCRYFSTFAAIFVLKSKNKSFYRVSDGS